MDATDHSAVEPAEAALVKKGAALGEALIEMADREMHASGGLIGPAERDDLMMFAASVVATTIVLDRSDPEGCQRAAWLIRQISNALVERVSLDRQAALGFLDDESDLGEASPPSIPPTGLLQ